MTDKIICVHAEHTHSHSHTTYIYIYRGKRDTRMRCACARSGSLSCLFAISESDDPISYRQVCSIHVIVCYAAMRIWPGDGAFLWNVCFFYFSYYLIFILVVYIYISVSGKRSFQRMTKDIYIAKAAHGSMLCCVAVRWHAQMDRMAFRLCSRNYFSGRSQKHESSFIKIATVAMRISRSD